ncbi:MAG: hypothetical protein R3A44_24055 [Caldilineaceae bacterium]
MEVHQWKDRNQPILLPLIKVVGISGAGKSTLVKGLRRLGYDAYPVSQEHSGMPDLWRQYGEPRVLIYLEVDLDAQRARRPDVAWTSPALYEEHVRLKHARDHAHLRIKTSQMEPEQVLALALTFLKHEKILHAEESLPPVRKTGTVVADTG